MISRNASSLLLTVAYLCEQVVNILSTSPKVNSNEFMHFYLLSIATVFIIKYLDDSGYSASSLSDVQAELQQKENKHEKQLYDAGFRGSIPKEYIDPVTLEIMVKPVILITDGKPTGISYDETTVVNLMKSNPFCPFSRKRIRGYVPNITLKNMIDDWVMKQKNKPLCHLPREVCQTKLLETPRFFNNRRPKASRKDGEPIRYRSYSF